MEITGHLRCTDGRGGTTWPPKFPPSKAQAPQAVQLVPGNAAVLPVRSRYWKRWAVGRGRSCALSRIAVKTSMDSLCFTSGLRVCLSFFSLSCNFILMFLFSLSFMFRYFILSLSLSHLCFDISFPLSLSLSVMIFYVAMFSYSLSLSVMTFYV